MNIPNPKYIQNKYIKDDATNIKGDKKYILSYKYYNDDECELKYLDKSKPKKILVKYRNICKCEEIGQLLDMGIKYDPIEYRGDYEKLYKGLNPDQIDMREDILGGSERLFYFIAGNSFNVVCIKNKHLETKKNRR